MPTKSFKFVFVFLLCFLSLAGFFLHIAKTWEDLENCTRSVRTVQPFKQFIMFSVHAVNSRMKILLHLFITNSALNKIPACSYILKTNDCVKKSGITQKTK